MKSGRELDALIAEKVMGLNVFIDFPTKYVDGNRVHNTPHYSTNIADAWLVVEKLRELGTVDLMDDDGKGWISLMIPKSKSHVRGEAETAPLAICLAALKAVGVEVEG